MKHHLLVSLVALGCLTGGMFSVTVAPQSAQAQMNGTGELAFGLNNAKNLARQTAEELNGGLGNYRAEPAMHGDPLQAPFVENPDGSYTFTFKGRRPESLDFSYESQITILFDGSVVVNYNGGIRAAQAQSAAIAPPVTTATIDLNQAKNLARQAAEKANGGLGNYRAESAMHGDPNNAPYVQNADGSYTFTFKGRRPESLDFTYQTTVTVNLDGTVNVVSNGMM